MEREARRSWELLLGLAILALALVAVVARLAPGASPPA